MAGEPDGEPDRSADERLDRLERRVERLERAVQRLGDRLSSASDPDEAGDRDTAADRGEGLADRDRRAAASQGGRAEGDSVAFEASPGPEAPAESLEERIGADLLAKTGVLVLVLGLAFFVAWAIETGLIGLRTRIVLGVLGGLGVVGAAHPFRDSPAYGRLARVLAGGGFGLAYFCVFAAHHFAEYQAAFGIGFWTDTVLLTVLAVGVAGYGLAVESPAFLLEALTLGVTTAFLADEFTTFTLVYATAIGLGVAGAAARIRASRVVPLALATIYGHGLFTHLAGDDPGVVLGALAVDGVLVAGFALSAPRPATPGVDASGRSLLYGANAAALVAVGTLVAETGGVLDEGVFALLAGAGLVLASLPAALRSEDVAVTSALTGLGTLLLGAFLALTPVQAVYAWTGAYLLLALARTAVEDGRLDRTVHALGPLVGLAALSAFPEMAAGSERTAALGLVALAYTVGFVAFKRGREAPGSEPSDAAGLHVAAAAVALAALLVVELESWGATVALGGAGLVPVLAGFGLDWPEPRWAGLGLLGLALGKAFLSDVWSLEPGLRVVAFVGLGLALVGAALVYARFLRGGGSGESEG